MSAPKRVTIDLSEQFDRLAHAPIVEAVIDIRERATVPWEVAALRSHVEGMISGYQFLDAPQAFEHELCVTPGKQPSQVFRDLGLKGVRFRSADKTRIVQFNRDGFVFSRLEPYEDWSMFREEAMTLRGLHREFAKPDSIHRLGVRFINRMRLPSSDDQPSYYLVETPKSPRGLDMPVDGFMHQDVLSVPGHAYGIKVIRTIQRSTGLLSGGVSILLDIDVYTLPESKLAEKDVSEHLAKMRWLKNKVFFGSVTEEGLKRFR